MDQHVEGQGSDMLEHRLRAMLLSKDPAAGNLHQEQGSPQSAHQSDPVPANGTGQKTPRSRNRARKEYVKLDLSSSQNTPQSNPQTPAGPRRPPRNAAYLQPGASSPQHVSNRSPHLQVTPTTPGQGQLSPAAYRPHNRSGGSRFNPLPRPPPLSPEQFNLQCSHLEEIAKKELITAEMTLEEAKAKEGFRLHLEKSCNETILQHFPHILSSCRLLAFGSISSGFGMPGSDMDLAFAPSYIKYDIPKALEKRLLELGHGARLLTRTRVPILKVCESPSPELFAALCKERERFDLMTPEEQRNYLDPPFVEKELPQQAKMEKKDTTEDPIDFPALNTSHASETISLGREHAVAADVEPSKAKSLAILATEKEEEAKKSKEVKKKEPKTWYREKRLGPLDFPKAGVGIQCDINFSNSLGLHNTMLLRCYSQCDVRVRLMVLFVKKWAKQRQINSSYSGTLSSYGFVLMVLHFLVNVAQPPVCPNLQITSGRQGVSLDDGTESNSICEGYNVRFWRNEAEIQALAAKGMLTRNREPLGGLLRNFFQYYATQGYDVPRSGFGWGFQVLSLRTEGGILSKQEKGWTEAKTTFHDQKEIRHRYLFAIEDPFELDHNIARTVTHNGIVAIRDEFRRAWRIISAVGRGTNPEGELFAPIVSPDPPADSNAKSQAAKEKADGNQEPLLTNAVAHSHVNSLAFAPTSGSITADFNIARAFGSNLYSKARSRRLEEVASKSNYMKLARTLTAS